MCVYELVDSIEWLLVVWDANFEKKLKSSNKLHCREYMLLIGVCPDKIASFFLFLYLILPLSPGCNC